MNVPDNSLSTLRQESVESRRHSLDEAYQRYQMATARYRGLLEKAADGHLRSQDDPLVLARDAESEALAEYTRLLKMGTDSRVHDGKRETQSLVRTEEEQRDGDFNFGR